MPYLVVRKNGQAVNKVSITEDELILGRQGDLVIHDVNASRKHAKIFKDESGEYIIEDLGSQNKTKLNGMQIEKERLNDHDEIQIGSITIVFNTADSTDVVSGGDPIATDVTDRGVMTFDEGDSAELADKLRGMLSQAKQSQAPKSTIVAKKGDLGAERPAADDAGQGDPQEQAAVENKATTGAGSSKLPLIIGGVVILIIIMAIIIFTASGN
ncbi:MAG: FHA domain-containing protein [Planctomycetes bacterium]|nr:FHA domain-containing protein [Planctomycetota bacterium]